MTVIPSLDYKRLIAALRRDGWVVVRQKGSHVHLYKRSELALRKLTVPAHSPIKRSTLSHLLKNAQISVERLLELL